MVKSLLVGAAGLVSVLLSLAGHASVEFGTFDKIDFSPAKNKHFDFPVELTVPADVTLTLYSADYDIVRVISSDATLPAGTHTLTWDGRDESGDIVPDEAYVPVLKATTATNDSFEIDPRTTGGETVDVEYSGSSAGDIVYTLQHPSRVLIRVGVKAGPMLRSLSNWEPKPSGRIVQRWDGYDADKLIDLRSDPRLSVLVTAFRLPDHAVITYGNEKESYRQYRARKNLPPRFVEPEQRTLSRGDHRISPYYYLSRAVDVEPRVSIGFLDEGKIATDGVVLNGDSLSTVKVDIHPDDRWALEQNLYEVAFFVDDEFIAEEEHGYVPLNWRWKPTSLKPGTHRLTVNISGFTGQVGVASVQFDIAQ